MYVYVLDASARDAGVVPGGEDGDLASRVT